MGISFLFKSVQLCGDVLGAYILDDNMFIVNGKRNDVVAIEKIEIDQNVTQKRQTPMLRSPQSSAKLQAEREMMGFIVSTPPGWWSAKTSLLYSLQHLLRPAQPVVHPHVLELSLSFLQGFKCLLFLAGVST